MPDFSALQIPPPANWQDFESLCCDLWREIWKDPNAQMNGRSGQEQHGVDVWGRPNEGNDWAGIQCKGRDNYRKKKVTVQELIAEVEKAKEFTPKLSEWILATTGQKDANVEQKAREITTDHIGKGLFSVHVWGWQDIQARLAEHPGLIRKYYSSLSGIFSNPKLELIGQQTQAILKAVHDKAAFSSSAEESATTRQVSPIIGSDFQAIVLTPEYQAEIDYARDLIHAFRLKECIGILENLRARVWATASPIVRFRLLSNLAAAKMRLEQYEEAARLILEAFQYNPDDEKALVNISLAHVVLKDFEQTEAYARKVLEKNPANSSAYCLLLEIPPHNTNLENALSAVPEPYRSSAEVAYSLGLIAFRGKRLPEAISWLEIADANNTEGIPEIKAALGEALIQTLWGERSITALGLVSDSQKETIDRAVQLLSSAWDSVAGTDLRTLKPRWIFLRGLARRVLGDYDGATKDFDTALEIDPSDPVFIRHRAQLAYFVGDTARAVEMLERIARTPETPEASLILAEILQSQEKEQEAVQILRLYLAESRHDESIETAKRKLIDLHISLHEEEKARELSDELLLLERANIPNLIAAAHVAKASGDEQAAISILNEAMGLVTIDASFKDLVALGDEFYQLKHFKEAAACYGECVDVRQDNDLTRLLLSCYYEDGDLERSLDICRILRVNHGPGRYVTDVEISIYEEVGDLPQAKAVCQEYLQKFPGNQRFRLRMALLDHRLGNFDEVDSYLASDVGLLSLPMNYGVRIAHLYGLRGKVRQCFDAAYELRRKYYNEPDVHLGYASMFFENDRTDRTWLDANLVAPDVAVCITDPGNRKEWYVIEDREDADIRRRELNPQHQLAQRLMGKLVGDEVVLRDGLVEERGTVTELKSKYVYALHETMGSYEKMFPGRGGLWQFHVGDPKQSEDAAAGVKKVLRAVTKQDDHKREIINLYTEGNLTLGGFAKLYGKNVFEIWNGLLAEPGMWFKCSRGDAQEVNIALSGLVSARPKLVADITSLHLIYGLEVHDIVVQHFGKPLIAQTTLDALQAAIREMERQQLHGYMLVGMEGDELKRQVISPEHVKKGIEYLEGLQEWIRENCQPTPYKVSLYISRKDKEILYEFLDAQFLDTMLIACDEGHLLFSEDERLRSFARGEYGVTGVWTQPVLMFLLDNNLIDRDTYSKAVARIAALNFQHVGIDGQVILAAARKAEWLPQHPFDAVVRRLGNQYSLEPEALRVAVDFIYELYRQPIIPEKQDALILKLLDALMIGRPHRVSLEKLTRLMKARFYLLPFEAERLTALFKVWEDLKILLVS